MRASAGTAFRVIPFVLCINKAAVVDLPFCAFAGWLAGGLFSAAWSQAVVCLSGRPAGLLVGM